MAEKFKMPDFKTYYQNAINSSLTSSGLLALCAIGLASLMLYTGHIGAGIILGGICLLLIYYFYRHYTRNHYKRLKALKETFPKNWQAFLDENKYYNNSVQKGFDSGRTEY